MADRWEPRPSGRAATGRPLSWREQVARVEAGPGVPWPVVLVVATLITAALAWLFAHRSGLLGEMFPVGYLALSLIAVVVVRVESVGALAVTPPLVAVSALVLATAVAGQTSSTSVFLLSVIVPLAELFWWMLAASVACLLIAGVRFRRRAADRGPRVGGPDRTRR